MEDTVIQLPKPKRISGLDGLRTIVILLIAINHLCQQSFWYGRCPLPSLHLPAGSVTVLFVLSGFCAGYFPNKEPGKRAYYFHRAQKLFPTYYIYIVIAVITYILLGRTQEVLNPKLLYYLIPAGIVPFCCPEGGILPLVHLWFLTPIVIAYLTFPLLLNCKWVGQKSAIHISAILCVAFVAIKWTLYLCVGKESFAYRFFNASQFDCIFGGLFLGLSLRVGEFRLPEFFTCKTTGWILWILFITSGLFHEVIPAPLRNEFFGLMAAGLITGLVRESAPFKFKAAFWRKLSSASYKIYVYHILAIILLSEIINAFLQKCCA